MLSRKSMILLMLLILVTSIVNADAPKDSNDLPLFPGSNLQKDGNETGLEASIGGQDLISSNQKYYTVKAPIVDVFKFYLEQTSALVEPDEYQEFHLSKGVVSQVFYRIQFHDFDNVYDFDHKRELSGEIKKKILTRYVKQFQNGKWMELAVFSWDKLEINSNYTEHYISLWDIGLALDWKSYKDLTGITVTTKTFRSQEHRDGSSKYYINMSEIKENLKYPNSVFLGNLSAFLSIPGSSTYLFKTTDPADKVQKYYEDKTGKKAKKSNYAFSFCINDGLAIDVYTNPDNQRETMIRIAVGE